MFIETIVDFDNLPKSYYYHTISKNLYLAHISNEAKKIRYKDKVYPIVADSINFIDKDDNFISLPYNKAQFKIVSSVFGLFKMHDKNKTILNLKTLKEHLLSISRQEEPEPAIIFILSQNNKIKEIKLYYDIKSKYKMELEIKNLLYFLSLTQKIL